MLVNAATAACGTSTTTLSKYLALDISFSSSLKSDFKYITNLIVNGSAKLAENFEEDLEGSASAGARS